MQPAIGIIGANGPRDGKPEDHGSRRYYEHQQTAYRLSAQQGAALSHDEQQARQKLAQEAPVVLAQLEAKAKAKIAAQLAASVGLATLRAPPLASGRNRVPLRQQSMPVIHSATWLKWLGHPRHSRSAVWPASSSAMQHTAGSWRPSSSTSQAAAVHPGALIRDSSEVQGGCLSSSTSHQQQQMFQARSEQSQYHPTLPHDLALPQTRSARQQQQQSSEVQPAWEQHERQHGQVQVERCQSQPLNTAQEHSPCAAERQPMHLCVSSSHICGTTSSCSSSTSRAHIWDGYRRSGPSSSLRPILLDSKHRAAAGTLQNCSMQPLSSVDSITDGSSNTCCREHEHELQPLLGQWHLQRLSSQRLQGHYCPLVRSQAISTADCPEVELPGQLASQSPQSDVSIKRPTSPVAQVLMTCHAAAVAALGNSAGNVATDPMLEPLLTSRQ